MNPIKPFLTYDQQINHLINTKGLTITDTDTAKKNLEKYSYYALIGGYKSLFYDPMRRTYIPGTTFEDMLTLYKFDDALRGLVFQYTRIIEQHMRSLISYYFCENYTNNQSAYLNTSNYFSTKRNRMSIPKLVNILDFYANKDTEHPYIVYQRNTYGNVPLYAVMKALTLGQTSKMYNVLHPRIKAKICQQFPRVNERELVMYLQVLTHFRNVCAHNERLFSYKDRYDIPDTALHRKLGIQKKGSQYLQGKKDLFAIVITFRYLLNKAEFLTFKKELSKLIDKAVSESSTLNETRLITAMGFPSNWKKITTYQP